MITLNFWWQLLIGAAIVYLLCNVNFAVLISKKFAKQDIRSCGSGNPGTTNMLRSFGLKFGAITFLLDMTKGLLAALAGKLIFLAISNDVSLSDFAAYFLGMWAIIGHVFPVFLKFHGGKGFATAIGLFLITNWMYTLIFLVIGLLILLVLDYMSVFALFFVSAELVQNVLKFFSTPSLLETGVLPFIVAVVGVVWLIVVFAHRGNIKRLFDGNENKTGVKKIFKKK